MRTAILAIPLVIVSGADSPGPRIARTSSSGAAATAGRAEVPSQLWFRGDCESGDLRGWGMDAARPGSLAVVSQPVRRGRYALRVTLAPGDRAAGKERAELKIGDKEIERTRGREGGEVWYAWSLLLPDGEADPPGEAVQIVAQWHHRPLRVLPSGKPEPVSGPPPLTLHLNSQGGRPALALFGRPSLQAERRLLGERTVRRGAWIDLLFHIRWSTGKDGFVEAWVDGKSLTRGRAFGPNLYTPTANYLRLGLYRGLGQAGSAIGHVYLDELRIGGSREAVEGR